MTSIKIIHLPCFDQKDSTPPVKMTPVKGNTNTILFLSVLVPGTGLWLDYRMAGPKELEWKKWWISKHIHKVFDYMRGVWMASSHSRTRPKHWRFLHTLPCRIFRFSFVLGTAGLWIQNGRFQRTWSKWHMTCLFHCVSILCTLWCLMIRMYATVDIYTK